MSGEENSQTESGADVQDDSADVGVNVEAEAEQEFIPAGEASDDAETVSAESTDTESSLEEQLKQAQAKGEENWQEFLRARAEMENIKRRAAQDVEKARKFALEKFSTELLAVVDSLEMGLKAAEEEGQDVDKLREGSELTLKLLHQALNKFSVEALNPEGDRFNPEFHEAMAMQPSAEHEPNTVLNVVQKGYTLNGRLIRPAMVVVSKST